MTRPIVKSYFIQRQLQEKNTDSPLVLHKTTHYERFAGDLVSIYHEFDWKIDNVTIVLICKVGIYNLTCVSMIYDVTIFPNYSIENNF